MSELETVRRILVVDDEPSVRESLAEYLEDCGYAVRMAASAEEALQSIQEQPADAMIVDLRLPGLSGEELIERAHADSPRTRFVIHTGSMGYRLSRQMERIGMTAADVFAKPQFDLGVFAGRLEQLLG